MVAHLAVSHRPTGTWPVVTEAAPEPIVETGAYPGWLNPYGAVPYPPACRSRIAAPVAFICYRFYVARDREMPFRSDRAGIPLGLAIPAGSARGGVIQIW